MTSHPDWNQETGGNEVAEAFANEIRGKNVLITGISPESIGSAMASSIASQNPGLLILASRTPSKLEAVAAKIKQSYPDVDVKTVVLDLMSQEKVKKAAEEVSKLTDRLDIIINNAALMTQNRQWTEERIEGQFGANHVGHFLLATLLFDKVKNAAKSNAPGTTRIVNLTSLGHRLSPVRFHDYNFEGKEIPPEEQYPPGLPELFTKTVDWGYNGFIAYGQGKSANLLFSVYLKEHLKDQGIVSYAVHPGSIWTGLSRDLDAEGEAAIRKTSPFWKNHDQGAATAIVAAFDPALSNASGILLHDCQFVEAAPHASDPKIADRLWKLSEELVKREFKL